MLTKSNFIQNQKHILFLNYWNDYYRNIEQPENLGETLFSDITFDTQKGSLVISSGNAYVYNCYFEKLTAYDGGAILYSVSDSYFLVEKSYFSQCHSSHYTAGIRVTKGNCILAFVCGQKGNSNQNDAFCSICDDTQRSVNSVFDSSISNCEAKAQFTMLHQYGKVYVKSVNLSHNKVEYTSAIRCLPNKINEETKHGSDVLYFFIFK